MHWKPDALLQNEGNGFLTRGESVANRRHAGSDFSGRKTGYATAGGFAKRAVDVVVSLSALIFFGPLMIIVATLIFVMDPGPIFFLHRRIGRDGQSFGCMKFRTMAINAEERLAAILASDEEARREWNALHKLRNDPRVTTIGRFLRASSLDELPQFLNVLKGEMSIVGPRPIVMRESGKYGRHLAAYLAVRPGLTGLWQVSGRNDVSYRRRVSMDVFYCRNANLGLDLWVIAKTPIAVMRRAGVY